MLSRKTIVDLEERGMEYILGTRMRKQKEVSEMVLGRAGRYRLAGGRKVAPFVTWGAAAPFPVIPHSLLWGSLLVEQKRKGGFEWKG